jgi:hypothetical protein
VKYDPQTRTLTFASDDEVERFHAEITALLREAVVSVSKHGEAEQGKAAAQGVFKQFGAVMRTLNAFRRHLTPNSERDRDDGDDAGRDGSG